MYVFKKNTIMMEKKKPNNFLIFNILKLVKKYE